MFRCTVDGSHLGTSFFFFETKKGFCLIIIIIIIINIVEKGNFNSVVHSWLKCFSLQAFDALKWRTDDSGVAVLMVLNSVLTR